MANKLINEDALQDAWFEAAKKAAEKQKKHQTGDLFWGSHQSAPDNNLLKVER